MGRWRARLTAPRTRLVLAVSAVVAVVLAAVAVARDGGPDNGPDGTGTRAPDALVDAAYRDPGLPVPDRVADLLARMTLAEKVGQMTQVDQQFLASDSDIAQYHLGSILSGGRSAPAANDPAAWADIHDVYQEVAATTRLGIPIISAVGAVHGHNSVVGATIFPHNIGLGATRDPELVERIGQATAEEVAGTGIHWTFAPCVCVVRNDRWGRTYESFGEDPAIVEAMTSVVTGLQGSSLGARPASILATAKHYVGDGGTEDGDDRGDSRIGEDELREIHLAPFAAAVDRDVGAVMASFSSWNGDQLHGHRYLLTEVLKDELGFDGFVVSDWAAINHLDGRPGFATDEIATAINAGIDMVMVPDEYPAFQDRLRHAVESGHVPVSRIDDAVDRILTRKFELGLFELPLTDRSLTATVGSAEHRALARQAVRESLVVLKNDGQILPLSPAIDRLFVAGKSADSIGHQAGGRTITWQGDRGDITPGTTILEGIEDTVGEWTTVTYDPRGAGIDPNYDAAIAVVGETPYAEYRGDRLDGMGLDDGDLAVLERLRRSGVPVIVVLVSGRPLDIAEELAGWDALVAAWLPGTEGLGVADVLFGTCAPTGTLPVTWMREASQQPINDGDGQDPLFPLGYGLHYAGARPDCFELGR